MAYGPSHKQAFSSFQSHPTGMHVTRAREAPPVAANGNQHLLCNGRCRHRCHKPAQGAWEPRLDTLEPLGSHGRWHGNWSDGRHGRRPRKRMVPGEINASAAQLLWFDLQALRSCLRNRHLLFVGDSSMRIFFSALISMVNGTLEWDTPTLLSPHGGCRWSHMRAELPRATTNETRYSTWSCLAFASTLLTECGSLTSGRHLLATSLYPVV